MVKHTEDCTATSWLGMYFRSPAASSLSTVSFCPRSLPAAGTPPSRESLSMMPRRCCTGHAYLHCTDIWNKKYIQQSKKEYADYQKQVWKN